MMDTENGDKQFDAFLKKQLNSPISPVTEHRLQNRLTAFQESIKAPQQRGKKFPGFPLQWRYSVSVCLILAGFVWIVFRFGQSDPDTRPIAQIDRPLHTDCIDAGDNMRCDTRAETLAECLATAIKECLYSKMLLLADTGTAALEAVDVNINYGEDNKGDTVSGRQGSSCVELNVSMLFDHKLSATEERQFIQHVSDSCLVCKEYRDSFCVSYAILH